MINIRKFEILRFQNSLYGRRHFERLMILNNVRKLYWNVQIRNKFFLHQYSNSIFGQSFFGFIVFCQREDFIDIFEMSRISLHVQNGGAIGK